MENFKLLISAPIQERVANGENNVNLSECVLVNMVSEKLEQGVSVLCSGVELLDGKFNPLQVFKALGYTVIEWFDEDKPDNVEGVFSDADDKERFFVATNEYGFIQKIEYGLTDSVYVGDEGTKITVKPGNTLNDNTVNLIAAKFKRAGYEVTLKC